MHRNSMDETYQCVYTNVFREKERIFQVLTEIIEQLLRLISSGKCGNPVVHINNEPNKSEEYGVCKRFTSK